MIIFLFQSMLILTLFYIVFKIVFEKKTFFHHNRYFLLTGIVLSFLIPLFPLNFSMPEVQYVYANPNLLENSAMLQNVENSSFWQKFIQDLSFRDIVFLIYILGLSFGITKFFIQIYQLTRIFQQGEKLQKDGIQFIFTDHEISPFSYFHKIIINPNHYTNEQLNHIITHERIHIQQAHQLDVFLAEWTKIILWFFPLSWWYCKSVKNNLEFIADHDSIQNGIDKKAYQLNLVKISQQPSGSNLVNSFSKKLIKNRIKMLNKMKTHKQFVAYYAILVPVMILASIGLSAQVQSKDKKVEKVLILKDEKGENSQVAVIFDKDDTNPKAKNLNKKSLKKSVKMKNSDQAVAEFEIPELNGDVNEFIVTKDGKTQKILVLNSYPYSKVDVKKDVVEIGYGEEYIHQEGDIFLSPEELKNKIENGEIDVNKKGNEWMNKIELKDNKVHVFSKTQDEPTIYVDGKEVSKIELELLNPDQIAEMRVNKVENGKGSIEITTKK